MAVSSERSAEGGEHWKGPGRGQIRHLEERRELPPADKSPFAMRAGVRLPTPVSHRVFGANGKLDYIIIRLEVTACNPRRMPLLCSGRMELLSPRPHGAALGIVNGLSMVGMMRV